MGPLFAYSLLPTLSVALLLFFTAALRGGKAARGLAAYTLAVAAWCTALLLICFPATAAIGERLAAVGAFIAAGYLHAAYDLTGQRSYRLVGLAYAVALVITGIGAAWPGALYGPGAATRGPLFWPAMALAVAGATVPLWTLGGAFRGAPPGRRRVLRGLVVAGVLGYSGGMGNAVLLSGGVALPVGIHLVLGSLLVLAHVIRAHEPAGERRLLERSLVYAALAAVLSAGFLFGAMSLMTSTAEPLLTEYRLGTFFLLCLAALAVEPLRQVVQERLGKRLLGDAPGAADLARALQTHEQRADQAARLAELGGLVSAVAHEVRNPLGVLGANLKLLERDGMRPELLQEMRGQIERAGRFVDDLLRYGRPRPLELRMVDLHATTELALGTARQGLGGAAPDVEIERRLAEHPPLVEADQAQVTQLFVILLENALLAVADAPRRVLRLETTAGDGEARVAIEDSGPGVPEALVPRLFQPFVSGRAREGRCTGTGLGLAIARGIAERHGGSITTSRSSLGGARFVVALPRVQPVLAAAAAAPEGSP